MTRIAILSDIHANLFALDAVYQDLQQQQPDEILIGGDLVGRGPQGDAVVQFIKEQGWRSVKGNHEDYLLNFHHRRIPTDWLTDPVWSASRWMAAELSSESIDFIENIPFSLRANLDPMTFLTHGTPRSNQEGIGSWTPAEQLSELTAEFAQGETLVVGHTHRPVLLDYAGITIVNTGSVGLPFNGDWRAQYVILNRTDDDTPQEVEFRQVEYDRDAFLQHYKDSGFLAEGGITSALLYQELLCARPFLVPYLRWAEALGKNVDMLTVEEFLEFYDCNLSMEELFKLFHELVALGK